MPRRRLFIDYAHSLQDLQETLVLRDRHHRDVGRVLPQGGKPGQNAKLFKCLSSSVVPYFKLSSPASDLVILVGLKLRLPTTLATQSCELLCFLLRSALQKKWSFQNLPKVGIN